MSLQEALGSFPAALRDDLAFAYNEGGRAMADAMMERGDMPMGRALVAGLALDPTGRLLLEEALDREVGMYRPLPIEADEVVIGAGAHAATYAAVRNREFNTKPLVIDRNRRFGGTFAMTMRSSFFLNSRNRPGPVGAPGTKDALNVIPGAMMQPSDIGGFEYQANADLGLVVRMTLALNAFVRNATVEFVAKNGPRWLVGTNRGNVFAKRVVIATGLGIPKTFEGAPCDGRRVFSYEQFMERFDIEMFPLRGLGRVAVIGGGDSGKTVVEALTGYGPSARGSVASLDYVQRIDWYGIETNMTRQRWLVCNRTRYKPLASLFPSEDAETSSLSGNARIGSYGLVRDIFTTYDAVQIQGRSYDTVIVCAGIEETPTWRDQVGFQAEPDVKAEKFRMSGSGISLGRATADQDVVVVGPAARLAFEDYDVQPRLEENKVALFRLAPRTATLAMALPTPA